MPIRVARLRRRGGVVPTGRLASRFITYHDAWRPIQKCVVIQHFCTDFGIFDSARGGYTDQMIDWLTAFIPTADDRISNELARISGRLVRYDMHGLARFEVSEWQPVGGSYGATINVRGVSNGLWFSGNPVKMLTGQNLDGPDHAASLLAASLVQVQTMMPIPVALDGGRARLTRVDTTRSIDLGATERVRELLRVASIAARSRYQGRAATAHDTIYFGKHSRRHSVKMYCKADELKVHPCLGVPPDVGYAIDAAATGLLRIEVTVRGMQLKADGLDSIAAWDDSSVAREQWQRYWGRVELSSMCELIPDEVLALPRRLRRTYDMWLRGGDCNELLSRNTYYTHRRELRQLTGGRVDIGALRPSRSTEDVDPNGMVDVLNSLPEWHAEGRLAEWINQTASAA